MKKTRKIISLFLLVTIVLSSLGFANAENIGLYSFEKFSVSGAEIDEKTDPITSTTQLPYTLDILNFNVTGTSFSLYGEIYYDNSYFTEVDICGEFVKSTYTFSSETGRFTSLINSKNELEIIDFTIEEKALGELLLPVNSSLAGNNMIMLGVKTNELMLYFEGPLPDIDNDIFYNLSSTTLHPGQLLKTKKTQLYKTFENIESTEDIVDVVSKNESWRATATINDLPKEDIIIDDPDMAKKHGWGDTLLTTKALTSPVPGLPVDVFTKRGRWGSQNNPNNPSIGYSVLTSAYAGGTNNFVSYLVWQFIYSKPADMSAQTDKSSGGSTGIKITQIGEYVFNPSNNSFLHLSTSTTKRIKTSAIAVGIRSSNQIISRAQTTALGSGSSLLSSAIDILGKAGVPYISSAASLFSKFNESGNWINKGINYDRWWSNGDTAAQQRAAYNDIIRGHKLGMADKWLTKTNDHMTINYEVCQPRDMSRVQETKYTSSKYYFFIYERDFYGFYTEKLTTVDQLRDRSYYVYK